MRLYRNVIGYDGITRATVMDNHDSGADMSDGFFLVPPVVGYPVMIKGRKRLRFASVPMHIVALAQLRGWE